MDEDGESGSQSAVMTSSTKLSLWMTKRLWHARLSVPDTFLLEDGHLVQWYFTSASSGKVLKHANKRLDWEDFFKFFARNARISCWRNRKNSSWRSGVIATARRLKGCHSYPVMLTAADLKSLREKHSTHLLDDIVMIQSYVTKQPFAGCGVFETSFQRTGQHNTALAVLATFELARWPEDDVAWFEGIKPLTSDSSRLTQESLGFMYRNEDGTSKRVHGVVHRTLAATTKAIVEHVEIKTGEVILRVVAQYAFRPGHGQPTLLWLDSVTTQRSAAAAQSSSQRIPIAEKGIEDRSPVLHEQFREGTADRSWTTFFPPKLSELASGGSAVLTRRSASQQYGGLNGSYQTTSCSFHEDISKIASKALHASAPALLATSIPPQTEANPLDHGAMRPDSEAEREVAQDSDHQSGLKMDNIIDHDPFRWRPCSQHRQHFSLPTQSWANRSSGWRGLYFLGVGGDTRGKRAVMSERWPRKRSTGTTMRIDARRPDLRSPSSEVRRPWTAPPFQLSEGPGDGTSGVLDVGGTINRRLASKASGCFGDYCHHQRDGTITMDTERTTGEGKASNNGSKPRGGARLMASKMVPYASILKCRAEERAISSSQKESPSPDEGCHHHPDRTVEITDRCTTPSLVAERMRDLAINLNDQGRSEFYRLCSSDRQKVGVPETTQRAVEELLYEEALSHLHPTTIFRPVTVCDTCAMVYGCMDGCRKKTKQLKAVAGHNERVARIALRRRQLDYYYSQKNQARADTAIPPEAAAHSQILFSALRPYSDLVGNALATTATEES